MAFEIRPARRDDLGAIARVNVAAARAAYEHIAGAEALAALEPAEPDWAPRFERARFRIVACEDDEVVGFAFAGESGEPGAGELQFLFTDPRVWGRGAGRMLIAAALEALADDGFAEAVLWTEERNHRPRRIYEAAGWRLDGGMRERTWLGTEIRELRYRIALA